MRAFNLIAVLAVAVAFVSVNNVRADDTPTWEVTGGTAAFWSHSSANDTGSHDFNINGGLGYFFNSMYELNANVAFDSNNGTGAAGTATTKTFAITVGPTFNFMGTPENAAFVTAQAGITLYGGGSLDSGAATPNYHAFTYVLGFGKRIEIVKHVSWKPEVDFLGHGASASSATGTALAASTTWMVTPLQFSFLF